MKNILHIAGRELRAYFSSPLAYLVAGAFLFVSGYLFVVSLKFFLTYYMMASRNPAMLDRLNVNEMIVRPLMHNMSIILLFIIPLIAMRLITEEKRHQTIELLLTSPVSTLQIALGKYLGGLALVSVMVVLTAPLPITLALFGRPDYGPMALSYLGLYLMGAAFLAVGLVFSSLTRSQLVAGVLGIVALLMLWLLNWAGDAVGGKMGEILTYVSFSDHLDDLTKGVFDTKHIIYFLSVIILGIGVSQQLIDAHRWR